MSTDFLQLVQRFFKELQRKLVLRKYTNSTIAEYFRKQGAWIGEGCYIVPRILGTEPFLVKIGDHVALAQGVTLHTHDGGTWIFRQEMSDLRVFGPIIIEDNCLIGNNAHILPNVTIGRNSIVAPGSVVIKDVPPDSIVMGVPARAFGSVKKYRERCLDLWKAQKPPDFNFDSVEHYDDEKDVDIIMGQLRKHLGGVFKDVLE